MRHRDHSHPIPVCLCLGQTTINHIISLETEIACYNRGEIRPTSHLKVVVVPKICLVSSGGHLTDYWGGGGELQLSRQH